MGAKDSEAKARVEQSNEPRATSNDGALDSNGCRVEQRLHHLTKQSKHSLVRVPSDVLNNHYAANESTGLLSVLSVDDIVAP